MRPLYMNFCLKLTLCLKQHLYKCSNTFSSFAATNQRKHLDKNLMYRSKLFVACLLLKFCFGCVLAYFEIFASEFLVFGLILDQNFEFENLDLG